MKTFREIAEMHYASEPSNDFDKKYRKQRITALEKLLTEQLRIHDVVGRSKQLKAFADYAQKRMWEDEDKDLSEFVDEFLSL